MSFFFFFLLPARAFRYSSSNYVLLSSATTRFSLRCLITMPQCHVQALASPLEYAILLCNLTLRAIMGPGASLTDCERLMLWHSCQAGSYAWPSVV